MVVGDDAGDEGFEVAVPAELVEVDGAVTFDDPSQVARAQATEGRFPASGSI